MGIAREQRRQVELELLELEHERLVPQRTRMEPPAARRDLELAGLEAHLAGSELTARWSLDDGAADWSTLGADLADSTAAVGMDSTVAAPLVAGPVVRRKGKGRTLSEDELLDLYVKSVAEKESRQKAVESRLDTSAGVKASYKSQVQATAVWTMQHLKTSPELRKKHGLTMKDIYAGETRARAASSLYRSVQKSSSTSSADIAKAQAKNLKASGLKEEDIKKMMAWRDFISAVKAGKPQSDIDTLGSAAGLDATSIKSYQKRSWIRGEDRAAWMRRAVESDSRVGSAVQAAAEEGEGLTLARESFSTLIAKYKKKNPNATEEQVLKHLAKKHNPGAPAEYTNSIVKNFRNFRAEQVNQAEKVPVPSRRPVARPDRQEDEDEPAPDADGGTARRRARTGRERFAGVEGPTALDRSSGELVPAPIVALVREIAGLDVSAARVHRGGSASRAADALWAEAFTVGHDVYLGAEAGAPTTRSGVELLVHELVHTTQPEHGGMAIPGTGWVVGDAYASDETSADRIAGLVADAWTERGASATGMTDWSQAVAPAVATPTVASTAGVGGAVVRRKPKTDDEAATEEIVAEEKAEGVSESELEAEAPLNGDTKLEGSAEDGDQAKVEGDEEKKERTEEEQAEIDRAKAYNLKGHSVSMLVAMRKYLIKEKLLSADKAVSQVDTEPSDFVDDDFIVAVMAFQEKHKEELGGSSPDGQIGPGTFKLFEAAGMTYVKEGGEQEANVPSEDGKVETPREIVPAGAKTEDVYDFFKQSVIDNDGVWDDAKGKVNIVGIRGGSYDSETGAVTQNDNAFNKWNDTVAVLRVDDEGKKHVDFYRATTDPGVSNKTVATLPEGTYAYKKGTHKGYGALTPEQSQITPAIRNDESYLGVEGPLGTKGAQAINIHTTHGGSGKRLSGGYQAGKLSGPGSYSEGCTVIDGTDKYKDYWKTVNGAMKSETDGGAGQERVYYTIISGGRLGTVPMSAEEEDELKKEGPR